MDVTKFEQLSVVVLQGIVRRHSQLTVKAIHTRALLRSAVAALPDDIKILIETDVDEQLANGKRKYQRTYDEDMRVLKRRRPNPSTSTTAPCDPHTPVVQPERLTFNEVHPHRIQAIIDSDYLRAPTDELQDQRIVRFIEASSNRSLAQSPCGSCARLQFTKDLKEVLVASLPHRELLVPFHAHPAHDLHNGLLLHQPGLTQSGSALMICGECLLCLKSGKRPRFSLANNMWIGPVPDELAYLNLPERMLISRYFPAAFIIKLFPKHRGSHAWDRSQMHNGLRGNVSTYRLDPKQVAGLIDPRIYPPKANILSATIGITFVGPQGVRESTMPDMFRVRRRKVREALQWLQANNPLYADIIISEERLEDLPVNAIPEQLLRTAKYSSDIERVEQEHSGYVPDDNDGADEIEMQEFARAAGLEAVDEDDLQPAPAHSYGTEPAVFLLQSLGVVDIEGHDISSSELLAHALCNAADTEIAGHDNFAIRRGSAFVNEYARQDPVSGLRNDGGPSNANHLLGCFPCLFPYGKGGFETLRDVNVSYEGHARWALEYADKRFRLDPQFPFQVFGVMQKREVCRSAVLQMRKSAFSRHINLIHLLTPADFLKASQEETMGAAFTHPGIRALRDEMAGVRTKVKGTDESRQSVRSKIWGTNLVFNPPSLWLTINPADTQNPIAQVLAGADGINLDAFCDTAGPDNIQRAKNIASDPFASAQYFHLTIKLVLEQLFGVRKPIGGRLDRESGILGEIQAYIGTVEAQGRGTLHLHMLLWLKDTPSPHELKAALSSSEFREKMTSYISAVVKADIDGKDAEQVAAIPVVKGISYSRPLDPRTETIEARTEHLGQLARALQYHKCSTAACLKVVRGRLQCKRRAPWRTAAQDWVDEAGSWGPKRLCNMLNAFNPGIMHAIAANHDIKLILEGKDTSTITFYITNYATKKQQRSSNVSALLAKSLAFSKESNKLEKDYHLANKRLIQRCANSLTRYQEFSAPEVMTYIMDWGDVYESHHYVTIYWDSIGNGLLNAFPELSQRSAPGTTSQASTSGTSNGTADRGTHVDAGSVDAGSNSPNRTHHTEGSNIRDEMGTVNVVNGKATIKDNLRDYKYRGDELAHMSFYDFMLETYEDEAPATDTTTEPSAALGTPTSHSESSHRETSDGPSDFTAVDFTVAAGTPRRGRPRNLRILYKPEAKKPRSCRVIRSRGHETLPRFVGRWFPRNTGESSTEKEYYSACMLALLKPWSEWRHLKGSFGTFSEAFDALVQQGDRRIHTVIYNIQYYYDCLDGAKARQEDKKSGFPSGQEPMPYGMDLSAQDIQDAITDAEHISRARPAEETDASISEEDIEAEKRMRVEAREAVFGEGAISRGYEAGFFEDGDDDNIEWRELSRVANWNELPQFQAWEKLLRDTTRSRRTPRQTLASEEPTELHNSARVGSRPEVFPLVLPTTETLPSINFSTGTPTTTIQGTPTTTIQPSPRSPRVKVGLLNEEQKRAHDIVEHTICAELAGEQPPQLRLLILGQGGTSKSMLIGAITETLEFYGVGHWMAKTATTGIAASDIGGQTIHSWAGIARNTSTDDNWLEKAAHSTSDKRRRNIEGKKVLVLDEISMFDKLSMYLASEIVGDARAKEYVGTPTEPFGGMHVILAGDFHQFPPVGNAPGALYVYRKTDKQRAMIGREIFLQFENVVILRQQIRIRDPVWSGILNRLRVGDCTFQDIKEIEKLVLTNPECDIPNFQEGPWSEAILVTPRHAVRKQWNEHAIAKHCRKTGNIRYICPAEDTDQAILGPPGNLARFAVAGMMTKDTGRLADTITVAIGIKAMVVLNLATEADVANGTRGVIEDIVLDPREPAQQVEDGTVVLQYPPAMLFFRPDKATDLLFDGVPHGLLPITPSQVRFTATSPGGKRFRIKRRQFALTPGYAFTDYKSQGQTIEHVIIDIGKPPCGTLSPFGTYVALSRSRGRDTIRLLRDFDRQLFLDHPSEDLRLDMIRLERLDAETKDRFKHKYIKR